MSGKHESHITRYSDSSLYDEVCIKCGAHDITGGGWGRLGKECPEKNVDHELYQHYKGGIYQLLCKAKMEDNLSSVIVYKSIEGQVWVRPEDSFFSKFKKMEN